MTRHVLSRTIAVLLFAFFVFHPLSVDAKTFTDVSSSHANYQAISFFSQKGVISGTGKTTYSPKRTVTRAEFVKMLLMARFGTATPVTSEKTCFSDVPAKQWYAPVFCAAKEKGLVMGVEGRAFPTREIQLAEAGTLVVRAYDLPMSNEENAAWYVPALKALASKNLIPATFYYIGQPVSRAAAAEILWRALLGRDSENHVAFEDLALVSCTPIGDDLPKNIDMKKVRSTWLGWVNRERKMSGLHAYSYDPLLHASATNWSQYSRDIGKIEHKRPGTKAYYDYKAITSWFKNLGLVFKNVNGTTHTENIGWGYYECDASDCTQELENSIRGTFDFFMAERKSNGVHFRSVMNRDFERIGLGVAIDEKSHRYFLTVHYGTEIISTPVPICLR